MEFNRWWSKNSEEVYWLEVTDRKDLGVDLNAPQLRDDGQEYYGYSLIKEINDGDVVFHYHKDKKSIVACSRAFGSSWEDRIVWGAHGTTARGEGIRPYERPGWRLGLIDFKQIKPPLGLEQIRALENNILGIRGSLEVKYGRNLYFPFELSDKRALRPTQAYLTKLPKDIIYLMPSLQDTAIEMQQVTLAPPSFSKIPTSPKSNEFGTPYRLADEAVAVSDLDPFKVDPELVERAHHSHAITQNALADYLRHKGLEPRSPGLGEPNFDLGWVQDNMTFVAEIKSLTPSNEEKQLRLGLGQVLRYRHNLVCSGRQVRAIIMAEREPSDSSWIELCQSLDILLIWPAVMAAHL